MHYHNIILFFEPALVLVDLAFERFDREIDRLLETFAPALGHQVVPRNMEVDRGDFISEFVVFIQFQYDVGSDSPFDKTVEFVHFVLYEFDQLQVQAVAHTLEMGKYNEYSPMLDIVCAGKDVEGTYKVVKHLLDNVGTMYDFRKSGLYKHMKFRDIDEAILDGVKEKLLEGFRKEEEFGYMAGYEPWEKLIFDR